MKMFRTFPIETMGSMPINLGVTRGIAPGTGVLHNHPAFEVNLILQGETEYIIGGRTYHCHQGDIVLINEDEVHRAWNADNASFLVVQFQREVIAGKDSLPYEQKLCAPFWGLGKHFGHVIESTAPGYGELVDCLRAMEHELEFRGNSYRLMLKVRLVEFSVLLGRHFAIADNSPLIDLGVKSKRLLPVFDHVERHYADRILVEDLALIVNMSIANFTRLFRTSTGKSPMEYVMQQRIRHASGLLQKTDHKIIDIAADCGFPSISHFIAVFKKYTGQTPSEYRRDQQV